MTIPHLNDCVIYILEHYVSQIIYKNTLFLHKKLKKRVCSRKNLNNFSLFQMKKIPLFFNNNETINTTYIKSYIILNDFITYLCFFYLKRYFHIFKVYKL